MHGSGGSHRSHTVNLVLAFVPFCCGYAKMRWSIHTLVNLPNCLGMLVSRIAKHAFEILEPLLQEPIDGRISHDDQTRFI